MSTKNEYQRSLLPCYFDYVLCAILGLQTVAAARFLCGEISGSYGLPIYLVSAVATRLLFERSWCLIVRSVVWRLTNASASKCLMGTYLTVLSNNK